ncbi:DUF4123 domain-containing protein [Stenotrophomonas sp. 24(2023)]|uniref:DUF4123 domain-containing protein n=1 Tax=Stenotrophomonas sp. 24(2023) TaxID=3068324 RepID=UPI0027DEF2D0|nr:DUF4123 domain-containing protein [Stenotrophomonas sp. 24(2023)]WMJ69513.1 DUF4123 domain-containing protein [Stenotrophomonas sp. 24(2023)]
MPRYAVIDSAQRPHFDERLSRLGARYCSLFEGHAEASLGDIAALLVEYPDTGTDASPALAAEIARLAADRPAVSLYWSALDLQALARHFRAFHLARVPEKGGSEMLLRWYDTRILPALMDVFTPAQRAALLQGIQRGQYYDRFGDLHALDCTDLPDGELPALPPLQLDPAQYQALLEACEPDVVIAQLRRVIPDEMRRLDRRALYPFVSTAVQDTLAHGVQQTDDHVQYALLALYTSGGFRSHPAVVQRMAGHRDVHEQPFSDWVINLPEDIWSSGTPLWNGDAAHAPAPPAEAGEWR